jgi:hypothetical protein
MTMALVSKWLCGACVAKDVLFSVQSDQEKVFLICAACSAVGAIPRIDGNEFVEMPSRIPDLLGSWRLATVQEVLSVGEFPFEDAGTDFYENLFAGFSNYGGRERK